MERSHTTQLRGLGNDSNLGMGSFAAHKATKGDKTNASMANPLNDMVGSGLKRGHTKSKKKMAGDELEFTDVGANLMRQQTQVRGRKSIFIPRQAQAKKQKDMLDVSESKPKAGDSEDDDSYSDIM